MSLWSHKRPRHHYHGRSYANCGLLLHTPPNHPSWPNTPRLLSTGAGASSPGTQSPEVEAQQLRCFPLLLRLRGLPLRLLRGPCRRRRFRRRDMQCSDYGPRHLRRAHSCEHPHSSRPRPLGSRRSASSALRSRLPRRLGSAITRTSAFSRASRATYSRSFSRSSPRIGRFDLVIKIPWRNFATTL